MRRLPAVIGAAVASLVVAALVWVRVAPIDPADAHLDPLTAPRTGFSNEWRVGPEGSVGIDAAAPVHEMPAAELAVALDRVALAEPRTARLAGGPEGLWTNYVQRSRWIGFPDYVSVRAIDLGGGRSTLAIWSRSRFGRGDMGVNRARVERWLAALGPGLGGAAR